MVTEELYRLTERQRETNLFKIFISTDCIIKAPFGEPFFIINHTILWYCTNFILLYIRFAQIIILSLKICSNLLTIFLFLAIILMTIIGIKGKYVLF